MAAVDTAQITRVLKGASPDAKAGFAFALGSKPEQSVLVVDRQKEPGALLSTAKKEGGSKACCGRLSCKGSEVTFETDDPLPSFTKHLNDFFKHNKLSFKATVTGVQADVEDDDEEDDATDGPAMFQQAFVGKMLQKARRRPLNFAFAMGRTPEASALGLHGRKPADGLFRLARQQAGTSRGGYGNVTAEGKLVQFHCEESPAPGMRKGIRGLFKSWGLKNKVQIFGPEGEFEVEDIDEDDEDGAPAPAASADAAAEPAAAAAQPPGDAAIATLRDELRALLPDLRNAAGGEGRVPLQVAYRECEAALAAGNAPAAAAQLRTMRDLLARQGAVSGQTAALRAELDGLMPALKEAAKLQDRAEPVREAWKNADAALKAGEVPAAEAAMAQLRELARLPAAGVASARAAWPDVRSRWQNASETVDRQVSALQAALRSSNDAELAEIADGGLIELTGNFRTPMMAAVVELDRAAGEAFQAAAAKALGSIEQFAAHVAGDKRIEAVDDNPFGVTVTIKQTLGAALGDMRRVLSQAVG